jgi:hypothetical protein
MLANRASVGNDQLLYLEGAGWDHVVAHALPWSVAGFITGLFEFDDSERGSSHIVRMSVRDVNGVDLGSNAVLLITAASRVVPFAVQFSFVVEAHGSFDVVLSRGSELLLTTTCPVVPPPQ